MRERILSEVQRLHKETGAVPGNRTFQRLSGIAEKEWKGKIWARWGDAIREAGLEPNSLSSRYDDEFILGAVADAALRLRKLPTHDDLRVMWRGVPDVPSVKSVENHFPRWVMLVEALRHWVQQPENVKYAQVADMLPTPVRAPEEPANYSGHGHVYLLRAGDYYKIGQSADLEKRVKSINVALPDKATLEHAISTDDPSGIEAYWHRRFADRRMNGKWFKLSKTDILAIKKRKFQ